MEPAKRTVVIRADGGQAIGLGHVTRCLALAEELIDRGMTVTFLTRTPERPVLERMERARCGVERLDGSEEPSALGGRAAFVVVDLYGVTPAYQEAIRSAGARLLVVDDVARSPVVADLLLNQNLGVEAATYSVAPHTRVLLGPRYALLRRAFRGATASPAVPIRLLVTMGGSDPHNATTRVVEALEDVRGEFALDVVVGPSFVHDAALAAAAGRASHAVAIHRDPPDLAALMGRATLAVSAAGSTCWELAHLGVPAVVLVLADNQAGVAAGLAAAGLAVSVGPVTPFPAGPLAARVEALLADAEARRRMAAAGRTLVDGRGAARVAEALCPA